MKRTIALTLVLSIAGSAILYLFNVWIGSSPRVSATMTALQDYTRLKRSGRAATPVDPEDLAWSLVLDSLVFDAEAEIRWLDHCEARLRRADLQGSRGSTAVVTDAAASQDADR